MAELLAEVEREEEAFRPLRAGETVEGTVAGVSGDEVLVDLAGHSAGVLSLREADASLTEPLEVGDTVFALVVHPEGPEGHAVLSLRRARRARRWQEMAQLQQSGEVIAAPVVEANRGGVVVDLGVRGFVPLSPLASLGALERPAECEGVPGAVRALVGKDLTLKVIEVDQKRNRLILSEKAATQELRRQRKARAAEQLNVGDVLEGTVTHATGFGLFVDVGLANGLVHRSEITWDKGVNPLTIHQQGDPVRVVVTAIDPVKERISLSIRQLADDPWTRVGTDFTEGGTYDADHRFDGIRRVRAHRRRIGGTDPRVGAGRAPGRGARRRRPDGGPRSGEDRGYRPSAAPTFCVNSAGGRAELAKSERIIGRRCRLRP